MDFEFTVQSMGIVDNMNPLLPEVMTILDVLPEARPYNNPSQNSAKLEGNI